MEDVKILEDSIENHFGVESECYKDNNGIEESSYHHVTTSLSKQALVVCNSIYT